MRRINLTIILYLTLAILLTSFVHSSDCLYKDYEDYVTDVNHLCYQDSHVSGGKGLVLSDFSSGPKVSFFAYNPNRFDLFVNFNFTVEGQVSGSQLVGLKIPANSTGKVQKYCFDGSIIAENCSLIVDSINYTVTLPALMYPCVLQDTLQREVCNKPCTSDNECNTKVCNFDGYCGDVRNVSCSSGKLLCQNRCVVPGSKKAGEASLCDRECASGKGSDGVCKVDDGNSCTSSLDCTSGTCNFLGKCGTPVCPDGTFVCNNQACVTPSIKKNGEAYSCKEECKSGYGLTGVCADRWLIQKIIIGFLILCVILVIYLLKGLGNDLEKLTKRKHELENESIRLNDSINKIRVRKEELEKEEQSKKEILKKEEGQLLLKISKARGEAKQVFESELHILREQYREDKRSTHEKKKKLSAEETKITEREEKIKERQKKLEEDEQRIKETELTTRVNAALHKYNPLANNDLDYNGRYLVFKGSGEPYHVWSYKNHLKTLGESLPANKSIHHIDRDKLNNELYNLIPLDKDFHDIKPGESQKGKFSHNLIESGNWESGITQVLQQCKWKKEDLPKHIQEHMNQKKL